MENDTERFLKLNRHSRFFSGLRDLEMESRIRPFLHRYADFDFTIDYDEYKISFYRNVVINGVGHIFYLPAASLNIGRFLAGCRILAYLKSV